MIGDSYGENRVGGIVEIDCSEGIKVVKLISNISILPKNNNILLSKDFLIMDFCVIVIILKRLILMNNFNKLGKSIGHIGNGIIDEDIMYNRWRCEFFKCKLLLNNHT